MPRYVSKPRLWWDPTIEDEIVMLGSMTVHEGEVEWTGLLDQYGNDLFRTKEQIGFKMARGTRRRPGGRRRPK